MTKDLMRLYGHLLVLLAMVFMSAAYRLPTTVKPEHYKLRIDTHFDDNFTFNGTVSIQVEVTQPTDVVVLHCSGLNITHNGVSVFPAGDQGENLMEGYRFEPENDFYLIKMKQDLETDTKYIVHIPYRGALSRGLSGYYLSTYQDMGTNTTKWLAVTHFEPTAARRAFPCFDEPAMKARFTVSLGRQDGYASISNMPLIKTECMEEHPNWSVDHFQTSTIMSTYLVAFMVADFEFREKRIERGNASITFRTWARPDAYDQTEYATEIGPEILQYFEKYFDVQYPLPKMDMVAVPDFGSGAMENWGLNTYREDLLLYDPKEASVSRKRDVANTISHELAHQWFGNLVTMKWWNDLWLKEGFATYLASLGANKVQPEWKDIATALVKGRQYVLFIDALNSSHPVSMPIGNPRQMFDTISYQKGCFLIKMMTQFLGMKVFRMGLNNYLKKYSYDNAEQDNLWECLTKAAHSTGALPNTMTVKQIMDTWTLQTGYPLVTVLRDYETGKASILQYRYSYNWTPVDNTTEMWLVPLSFRGQSKPKTTKLWFLDRANHMDIGAVAGGSEWVIFNVQSIGLYRVLYDERNWKLLSDTLNSDKYCSIDVLDRIVILDDALNLAWISDLDYDVAMGLSDYLVREREYLAWPAALWNFGELKRVMKRTPGYGDYRKYMSNLLTPVYKLMGNLTKLPKATDVEALEHHLQISEWACTLEMGSCVRQALELYDKWASNPKAHSENPIPSDLRSIVYCTAVKFGGETQWNFIWNQYLRSNVESQKSELLQALGCSRDMWLLERFLHWSVNKTSGIPPQDSSSVFFYVASNPNSFQLILKFFKENIQRIYIYHGGAGGGQLSNYVVALAGQIITPEELRSFKMFLDDNRNFLNESTSAMSQSLEAMEINVQWYSTNYHHFQAILEQKNTRYSKAAASEKWEDEKYVKPFLQMILPNNSFLSEIYENEIIMTLNFPLV